MSDGREYFRADKVSDCYISPETLAEMSEQLEERGNIGVAFTYNEPLISYEYVRDTAKLLKEKNQRVVLVTNGCVNEKITNVILPYVDAMNVDLKSFQENVYRMILGGDLETVKRFISDAAGQCHVELTCLIVPGMNDTEGEIRSMAEWISSLPGGREIPLHITRFFPRYKVQNKKPTERSVVLRLVDTARQQLKYVYAGNL